ncbi:MAG: HAMP domain-containing histidine kinase [Bacteroidales bacterium]|nr:HAMP domain-containing histidine kinase [Bacteroidales bacterium]
MKPLSDEQLLSELKKRFEENRQSYQKLEELNNELSKANKKLIESEQLKSNFLSNARNEIINPLSSILSLAQAIAFSESDDAEQTKSLATIIYNEAFDLNFQMNNIFASAEIEAGEAICENYTIDLIDLIEKIIDKFKTFALDKGHNLIFHNTINNSHCYMKSDPAKIQIIISNLIVNAVNWSGNTEIVEISLKEDDSKKIISVSDNGPGIAEGDQKIIFDRFKSLDPAVHTKNKGHGLGLSIARAHAELLGGEITIESQPGHGSTFSLILPNSTTNEETMGFSESGQDFIFDNDTELF